MSSSTKFTPPLEGVYYIFGRLVRLEAGKEYTMESIMKMSQDPKDNSNKPEDFYHFWTDNQGVLPGFSSDYGYWDEWADMPRTEEGKKSTGCDHKWANYVGFLDAYEYCEKCNVKRNG